MRAPATILLASILLATSAHAQMTALVNDPMSHGTLGDGKLSLDEAIRIMNSSLAFGSLSPGEQAQLRGAPVFVLDTIEIDASITPTIVLEKQLTDVIGDTVAHVDCNFHGLNGRPVIDASVNNIAEVFPSRTNHFHLRNMVVIGGQTGITYDTSLHYHPGEIFIVDNCLFVGQSRAGIETRVPAFPPGGIEIGEVFDTVFKDLPIGMMFIDQGLAGDTDMRIYRSTFDGCDLAVDFRLSGFGGTVDVTIDRTAISGATTGIKAARQLASDTTLNLQLVHDTISASGSAIDLVGDQIGGTVLGLMHSDVRGGYGASDYALQTSPANGRFDVTIGETSFEGAVALRGGRFSTKADVQNSRFGNGPVEIESSGAEVSLTRCSFHSAPITVPSGATKTINATDSEFVRSPIVDQTSAGVVALTRAFLASSPLSANVSNQVAVSAPWIGTASVSPTSVAVGGSVDLGVDLQADTAAAWMLGLGLTTPSMLLAPHNVYLDLVAPSVVLPGFYGFQQTLTFSVPNDTSLSGVEFYAMPVLVPTAAQSSAPTFHLMRGGRIAVQ